jgi:tellurite resistance protein
MKTTFTVEFTADELFTVITAVRLEIERLHGKDEEAEALLKAALEALHK